jgi:hypothetical protein
MNARAVPPGDQATVTVSLTVDRERAFKVFTEDLDRWWRRGPRFRNAPGERGFIRIEPGCGGRVFESFDSASGTTVIEIGRIKVWEPPSRLLFEWRNANFAPFEKTEVEVRFEATPPLPSRGAEAGCRVTVVHRGWSEVRPDHPARHGKPPAEFLRDLGRWWGDQLTTLRVVCAGGAYEK